MLPNVPLLSRFAERPREVPPGPDLRVGPDGLTYRPGSQTPFVDELRATRGLTYQHGLFTVMTKNADDAPDPDLVRSSSQLETLVTRTESEPSDPDMIRADTAWALVTSYTSGGRDRPDPDGIRQS